MGENTRIPQKVPEYQSSEPVKKANDIKRGKLGDEHEVTFLSIIKDIHIQGFLKTIQSLFEFIFPMGGSKPEAKENHDYVITASLEEVKPIYQISSPILTPQNNPAAMSLKDKVKQGKATYNDVVDALKERLIDKQIGDQLFIRPAPGIQRNAPMDINEIKTIILADNNTKLTDKGILINSALKQKIEEFIKNLSEP